MGLRSYCQCGSVVVYPFVRSRNLHLWECQCSHSDIVFKIMGCDLHVTGKRINNHARVISRAYAMRQAMLIHEGLFFGESVCVLYYLSKSNRAQHNRRVVLNCPKIYATL